MAAEANPPAPSANPAPTCMSTPEQAPNRPLLPIFLRWPLSPSPMSHTVVLFMNGVTHEPFNYFSRVVPLHLTGAAVKNMIATVDCRDPSRYMLFRSFDNLPVDLDVSLEAQG
eukprot:gene3337-13365_t